MKTLEDVLKENPGVYLWKDKKTLDFTISDETRSFSEEIKTLKCLVCEVPYSLSNKQKIQEISESVCGINMICLCGQKWYIHKPVMVPKNLGE